VFRWIPRFFLFRYTLLESFSLGVILQTHEHHWRNELCECECLCVSRFWR
jgi:hypothetical protein